MPQCNLPTRQDYRRLFNYYFNADGDPGVPYIETEHIGLGVDVSQNGWASVDAQFFNDIGIDISASISSVVVGGN